MTNTRKQTVIGESYIPHVIIDNAVSGGGDGGGSAATDAFGRSRVSEPETIFDSKLLHDKAPLFWDEQITDGGGSPTSVHTPSQASVTMTVNDTGDKVIRQTKVRPNYQPGKSQLMFFTAVPNGFETGVRKRIGAFDVNDGVFFELDGDTAYTVVRKAGVDTKVPMASWDDSMDGNGSSGTILDFTKDQIFVIDFEWLGVGIVRYGFVVDGNLFYCYTAKHANVSAGGVYMSTPNNPIRYEIESTSGAGSLERICSTIMSEGGHNPHGITYSISTSGTNVNANTENVIYGIFGVRLKSTHLDATVKPIGLTVLAETNDDFEWLIMWNPTVAVGGGWTFSDVSNTSVQVAQHDGANPGGNVITENSWDLATRGFGTGNQSEALPIRSPISLGSNINGDRDVLVLGVRPLSAGLDFQGTLTLHELL